MEKIVVGIDGSDASKDALRFGLEEGRLRGVPVFAVHAWEPPPPVATTIDPLPATPPLEYPALLEEFAEGAQALVDSVVEEVLAERPAPPPEAPVSAVAVEGPPAEMLLDAARDADLIVVGSRGHGGFVALLLGSVGEQVARHAECPVVIHRRRRDDS